MADPLHFEAHPDVPEDRQEGSDSDLARVIVKVRRSGYVPDGFRVRSRVDDLLFTAEAPRSTLRGAEGDPDIESVEYPRRLTLE